eukprot:260095-Hanusia_phi.AAC.2
MQVPASAGRGRRGDDGVSFVREGEARVQPRHPHLQHQHRRHQKREQRCPRLRSSHARVTARAGAVRSDDDQGDRASLRRRGDQASRHCSLEAGRRALSR